MVMPQHRVKPAVAEDQETEAYRLATQGASVREIAAALAVSVGTAHARLKTAIQKIPTAERAMHRQLALERLDLMTHKLMNMLAVDAPPLDVIPELLKVEAQRAKLLGLNEPVQVSATVHEVDKQDLELAELVREAEAKAAAEMQHIRDGAQ